MLTEAAQFEMADFKDRRRYFGGKSTSHEQWPANILTEEDRIPACSSSIIGPTHESVCLIQEVPIPA